MTGGNGGIGLGIAQGLAQAGAHVAIVGRNTEKNAAAAKALGGTALALCIIHLPNGHRTPNTV